MDPGQRRLETILWILGLKGEERNPPVPHSLSQRDRGHIPVDRGWYDGGVARYKRVLGQKSIRRCRVVQAKIEVLKRSPSYPAPGDAWSNVYHFSGSSYADAEAAAVEAMNAELPLYLDTVEVYELRITPEGVTGVPTSVVRVSEVGGRTDVPALLPNWNVAQVDFSVPTATRVCRKYLRASIGELDVEDFAFVPDFMALLTTYATAIASYGGFANPHGQLISSSNFNVRPTIAMRQTGWSRRSRPGFHRGYIPD